MKVAKWGNSLAIRIPAPVAEIMDLKEGDDVTVTTTSEREVSLSKSPTRSTMLERLRKYRGMLPADWKFNREEANER